MATQALIDLIFSLSYNSRNTEVFVLFLRILCETVKDFVAKVGKAYEKSAENAEECDTMSLKVSLRNNAVNIRHPPVLWGNSLCFPKFLLFSPCSDCCHSTLSSLCSSPLLCAHSVPSWTRNWTPSSRPSTRSARLYLNIPTPHLPL